MTAPSSTGDATRLRHTLEQLLPTIGADAALTNLRSTPTPTSDRANVVVVGELSTGKTSLINALLNRPTLLPVTPTTAYVALGGDSREKVHAHYDDGRTSIGQLAHLDTYLAARADERVDHVEVFLDDPRLAQLTLFDTPGVGGTDSAARQLTLAALRRATAAVFVCSAEAKISLTEREFLAEAAARIDQIVFVLTKIDAYSDWKQNLTENIDTIRGDFHRFQSNRFDDLVFIPVSARLAEIGAERANPHLIQESGIDALWTRLTRVAAMHSQLAELNTLRSIESALAQADAILTARQQSLEAVHEDAEFAAITSQITEWQQAGAAWRSNLDREFDSACEAVRRQLRRRTSRLRANYDTELHSPKLKTMGDIEARVIADLCSVQQQVSASVREHLIEIARRILVGMPGADTDAADLADRLPDRLPDRCETPSDYLLQRPPRPKDPSETIIGINNAFVGSNMARTLTTAVIGAGGLAPLLSVAAPVAAAVALPVGVLWWRLNKNARHRAGDLAGLRDWISTCITVADAEIGAEIDTGFKHASRVVRDEVDTVLTKASDTARAVREDRARAREQIAADISQLTPLKQSVDSQRCALLPAGHPPTGGTDAGMGPD
ncbi:dynamin family protein [Nocardia gipuzkoensis]|uniref:dynamin family protein n=1 Tax=Nocardia gipuzkoensis TaxID=2749991 RepID=UPI003EDEE7A9